MKLYSRKKAISAAIQYSNTQIADEEHFQELYGSLFSKYPMGYNFEIIIKGSAQYKKEIMEVSNLVHDIYDHSLLNNTPEFSGRAPTFELFAQSIYLQAKKIVADKHLNIILKIDDKNWVIVKSQGEVCAVRSYKINCVHRHHNPDLSMDENKQLYGKCSAIHGHEYTVEVSLSGQLNKNGQIINVDRFDELVADRLIKPFHKTYLNDEMGNTSGELISELFYKNLAPALPQELRFDLTLRETRKNSFVKLA